MSDLGFSGIQLEKARNGLVLGRSSRFPAMAEVQDVMAASHVLFNGNGAECSLCSACAPTGLTVIEAPVF